MKLIFTTSLKPINVEKISVMQKNSLNSWSKLKIDKKIFVFNKNQSVKDFCSNLDVEIVEDYECSPNSDIPTWRTMRDYAAKNASDEDVIVWVNGDVMFDDSLIQTIDASKMFSNDFVLVGQKYDWSNFYNLDNDVNLKELQPLELHGEYAIDYFIFKKHLFENLPGFYIARQRFDNFLVGESVKKYKAINCTKTLLCIHHRHEYGENVDIPFHQAHSSTNWQNEQVVNDSLITSVIHGINHCPYYSSYDSEGKIKITKR